MEKKIIIAENKILRDLEGELEEYKFPFYTCNIEFSPRTDKDGFIYGEPEIVLIGLGIEDKNYIGDYCGLGKLATTKLRDRGIPLLDLEHLTKEYIIQVILNSDPRRYEEELKKSADLEHPKKYKKEITDKILGGTLTYKTIKECIEASIPTDLIRLICDLKNDGCKLEYGTERKLVWKQLDESWDYFKIGKLDESGYKIKTL